jgi:hypothetical protein
VPGPFADDQLAAFVAQPSPPFAQLDVTAMREGIAHRARKRSRGPEMQAVHEAADRRAPGTGVPPRRWAHTAGRLPAWRWVDDR